MHQKYKNIKKVTLLDLVIKKIDFESPKLKAGIEQMWKIIEKEFYNILNSF